eukprot:m51a1_g12059 putative bacillolysin (688) ;mRNA; r:2176-4929
MERTLGILLEETPEFGEHLEMHMIGEPLDDPHVTGWSISTHQQSIDAVPIVGALLKVLLSPTRSLGPVLLTPLTIDLATHAQVVWNSEGDIVSVTGTTVPDAHQRAHLQGRAVVGKEDAVAIAQHEARAEDGSAKCVEAREVVLRPGMANGEPGPNVRAWEVLCGTSDVEQVWREFSGRDCYDNKGSDIVALMHVDMNNAYYENRTMAFGKDFVALSILWHEYAHGITDFLDGLWYEAQSGALNEGWSDIFSTVIDILANGHPQRQEDVSEAMCFALDNAGVHINSLIPSHAFALLTDGSHTGGFDGIGLNMSMKIFTRAKYAAYLRLSCEQLKQTGIVGEGACEDVSKMIQYVGLEEALPCYSATPSLLIDEGHPVTPRVLIERDPSPQLTLFVGGNFTGATVSLSGGSSARCSAESAMVSHIDPFANTSNPIWIYQVQCPVPEHQYTVENATVTLDNGGAFSAMSFPLYWADALTIVSIDITATGLDLHVPNLRLEAVRLRCGVVPEHGIVLNCLKAFLCDSKSEAPWASQSCLQFSKLFADPGVISAVLPDSIGRGRYFVYATQHGLKLVGNAAELQMRNNGTSLRVCCGVDAVRVVASETVFGVVTASTNASGCATLELEQDVEYSLVASKSGYQQHTWTQTISTSSETVNVSLTTSGSYRSATDSTRGLLLAALSSFLGGLL